MRHSLHSNSYNCLVCYPTKKKGGWKKNTHSTLCFLIGIPTRRWTLSAKCSSPIKQSELSPVTNYPALPRWNRCSLDYISCCCIVNVPQPAAIPHLLSADANRFLSPMGWRQHSEWKSVQSQVNTIILLPARFYFHFMSRSIGRFHRVFSPFLSPYIIVWRIKSHIFCSSEPLEASQSSSTSWWPPSLRAR